MFFFKKYLFSEEEWARLKRKYGFPDLHEMILSLDELSQQVEEIVSHKRKVKRNLISACISYVCQGRYIERLLGFTFSRKNKDKPVSYAEVCEECNMCSQTMRDVRNGKQPHAYYYYVIINVLFMRRWKRGLDRREELYLFLKFVDCVLADTLNIFKRILLLRQRMDAQHTSK